MNKSLYEQINIWKRESAKIAICYSIFRRLSDNYYAVQSRDGYSYPIDYKSINYLKKQIIELFIEVDIEEREKFYPTIEEAISNFDKDFR